MVSGQLSGIINQPLLCKVTIQNLSGGAYVYDPTAGSNPPYSGQYDFILLQATCSPVSDYGVAGTFSIKLYDPTYTTILPNIFQYGEVMIWIGKTAATLQKVFLGSIEHIVVEEPAQNEQYITLSGPDWGSSILKNRIINYGWYQLKKPGLNDPDPADLTTRVGTIVTNILTQGYVYPQQPALKITDQGVIVNPANILAGTDGGLSLPFFEANFEFVDDKLSELDSYVNAAHYIDADKNFIMKFLPLDQSLVPDSGVLLTDDYTDSVAQGWTSGKIGMIEPGTSYELTSEMHKGNIYGLGGNQVQIDQSQQDSGGGSDSTYNQYLAVKFTPGKQQLEQVSLYISKSTDAFNTNPTDCLVDIVYDLNGQPNGSTVSSVSISKDSFASGETNHWHTVTIGANLVIGSPFWIIVRKQGADASHCYNWYKGGSGQTVATSSDGVNWTVTTNTAGYCFETWSSTPLLKIAPNWLDKNANWKKNDYSESVIRKPFIRDYQSMNWILAQETYTLFRYKEVFRCKVFSPDTLITPGQKVRIRKQLSRYRFDANYVVSDITYNFQADEQGAVGSFTFDLTGTLYSTQPSGQTTGAS